MKVLKERFRDRSPKLDQFLPNRGQVRVRSGLVRSPWHGPGPKGGPALQVRCGGPFNRGNAAASDQCARAKRVTAL